MSNGGLSVSEYPPRCLAPGVGWTAQCRTCGVDDVGVRDWVKRGAEKVGRPGFGTGQRGALRR